MSKLVVLLSLCAVCALLVSSSAQSATSSLAISEVYAGGGNAGATFANDYVELVNRTASPVSISGWTVQYASAASTSWAATPLSGTIRAGGYYLVKLASSGTAGAALPAADATGTTNLAASGGKIALVRDTNALSCGATAGSCAGPAFVEDFVGYGGATDYEGSAAAPSLGNANALVRASAGCTDTNDSASDFAAADPSPRNSSAAAAACAGGTSGGGTTSAGASVALDVQPVLSLALEKSSISFGSAFAGDTPAPVSEHVTVVSNSPAGYALSVHRSAFTPADLPLAIAPSSTAPLVPIPTASELALVSTAAASAPGGDVVPTSLGFSSALPAVAPGHYSATVTFTVIGR
jgi:lamin tail-like protein